MRGASREQHTAPVMWQTERRGAYMHSKTPYQPHTWWLCAYIYKISRSGDCKHALSGCKEPANQSYSSKGSQSSMHAEHTDPDLLLLRITLILKPREKEGGEQCVRMKGPKAIKVPVKAGQRYAGVSRDDVLHTDQVGPHRGELQSDLRFVLKLKLWLHESFNTLRFS